jgi:hypothetical protein
VLQHLVEGIWLFYDQHTTLNAPTQFGLHGLQEGTRLAADFQPGHDAFALRHHHSLAGGQVALQVAVSHPVCKLRRQILQKRLSEW